MGGDRIFIAEPYRRFFPPASRGSVESMGDLFAVDVRSHRSRTLLGTGTLRDAASGEAVTAYFKIYASRRGPLDGLFRRARALRETRNLQAFGAWGIPVAEVLAWGVRRCCALKHVFSFLVTEEIHGAVPLSEYWTGSDHPSEPDLRRHLISQLAGQTRILHRHAFCHQDLKWRNLLVVPGEGFSALPRLFWIDCPNGYRARIRPRRRHGRVKDLATLDKVAKDRCSPEERFLFLERYLEKKSGDPDVAAFAEKVVRYRQRRQDD